MSVKHLMVLTGLGKTTCTDYRKEIKVKNNQPKLVTPTMVCEFLQITYQEAYETLKAHYNPPPRDPEKPS